MIRSSSAPNERGSILIGIIVAMVVVGFLAVGMLSLTTTSTYHEIFASNHAKAYYVAESGGRYALAVIRDAYANDKTRLNAINAGQTFTLSNGDRFQILNFTQNGLNPETVTFSVVGTVSSGFVQAKRQINYRIQMANQMGGSGIPPGYGEGIPNLATLPGNVPTGSMEFAIRYPGGDQALQVTKDQGGKTSEAYVFVPSVDPNPFYTNWYATGGYSSYDLQVKIATGTPSGNTFIEAPDRYCNGLVFRGIAYTGQRQDFLGLSIMRSSNEEDDGIADGMIPLYIPPPGTWRYWAMPVDYVVGDIVYYPFTLRYYQCKVSHTSSHKITPGDTSYWTMLPNDKPMIVLWRRDGNKGNGADEWLAYKLLNETGGDYIVDGAKHIKPWSTILVRIVEAASVKLTVTSAPLINIGDTITGGSGTARVFRKINDSDGNVVLLLNNVSGGFSRPAMISTYTTDSSWGYRPRDNYIWAFYADIDSHSSNDTPLDNVRLGEPRSTINWPIISVQDWTATEDRFTLVQWNTTLNTSLDSSLHLMGTGKEAGGILRSSKADWLRAGPYTNLTFPGEIGLVSLGDSSTETYFDDLAYFIRGGFPGGGGDGSGEVIQSP